MDKWQRKLRELTGDKGLPRQYRREGGRVKLSEAAKKLKPLKFAADGGIIINDDGYYRRRQHKNTGAFSALQEPLTLDHAKRIMRQMGVLDKHITYSVDAQEEYIGRELYGYTTPDGTSVTFYPDAFVDREQLVKTIGHETVHVKQVRERGETQDSVELLKREVEARKAENEYWVSYKKGMKLK